MRLFRKLKKFSIAYLIYRVNITFLLSSTCCSKHMQQSERSVYCSGKLGILHHSFEALEMLKTASQPCDLYVAVSPWANVVHEYRLCLKADNPNIVGRVSQSQQIPLCRRDLIAIHVSFTNLPASCPFRNTIKVTTYHLYTFLLIPKELTALLYVNLLNVDPRVNNEPFRTSSH